MADLNKIIDDLSSLTVVEAAELSKQLEEKWGVTAATAVAAAPVAAGGATQAEEKSEFTIMLTSAKILTEFSKENKNLKILGGIMGKDVLDVAGVAKVATLPTLDEARAKIVGILRSPAQKITSILLAPASKIAILALEKSKK